MTLTVDSEQLGNTQSRKFVASLFGGELNDRTVCFIQIKPNTQCETLSVEKNVKNSGSSKHDDYVDKLPSSRSFAIDCDTAVNAREVKVILRLVASWDLI